MIIAIPSKNPGGLEAAVDAHFGHCDIYTLVDINEKEITNVRTLENVPHEQGGCMAPVNHLASNGVNILIAGGMGFRPLAGFSEVGIAVYHNAGATSVGLATTAFLADALPRFSPQHTCGGGEAHHNCDNH